VGIEKGARLGPKVVRPQKQPDVESELIATTEAKVSVVNLFERDIESTFIDPVIRQEAIGPPDNRRGLASLEKGGSALQPFR
jgi:hypothetical protein